MDLSGGRGRAMFAVQNLLPKTQTLTISCIYKKDKNNTSDRSLIELKLNGEISINGDAHKVVLGNEDPTKYICQRDNQNNALVTNISCNGRYLLSIDRKVESEDCNADGLLRLGVVTPTPDGSGKLEQTSNVTRNTFVCPHPCFSGHNAELTETCSSISNQNSKSSISIYEIQSLYQPPRIHKNKNSTSSSSKASVKCDFRSSLGGSGSLSLGVTVLKTRWPSIRDFLIEVEPGVLLSARGQAGSTSELLRYHSDEESGDGEKSLYTLPLPPYLVTLHTRTKITAIADFHGRFEAGDALSTSNSDTRKSVCPKVFIGGETAEVVSCSASNVTFFAPYFKDVCRLKDSNISRDSCGYQRVVIQNVDKFDAGELIAGGRIECPGSCPLSGLGFNYVSKCLNYESPTKCSSLTNPPDNCAYGAGDKCQDCPKTAVCPGGFRMWPRRGYWTSSEKAGTVFQCSAPPFERCLGWDIVNEMSKCGRAYDGVLCAECSDGYYEKLNICEACPDRQTRIAKIGLLIACMFVIYIIIYICLKYSRIERDGLLYNISKKDLRELIRWQAKDFVIWCMLVFQLLTLVIVSSGASAPELQQLIVWAGVASLNFQAVGPECFDNTAEAFVKEYTIFPVVIVAISIFFVLPRLQYSNSNIRRSKIRSRGYPLLRNLRLSEESVQSIRSKLISLLVFLYTPSTFLSVGITYCIESNNEEGKTVLVSWQNPNFECGGTTHLPVMTLGAACLILHTVGFPLWTWYINRSVISNADKLNNESRSNTNLSVFISTSQNIERDVQIRAKAWKRFFGDDYLPQYHWFVNVQMLLAFILCCTRVYFSNYTDREQIAKMCVNVIAVSIFGVLLVVLRPFVKHMEWKMPVQLSLLLMLVVAAVLELLNYYFSTDDENKGVTREKVEAFSYVVLCIAMCNIALLILAFWFVVFRQKSREFFIYYFIIQKKNPASLIHLPRHADRDSIVTSLQNSRFIAGACLGDAKFGSISRLKSASVSGTRSRTTSRITTTNRGANTSNIETPYSSHTACNKEKGFVSLPSRSDTASGILQNFANNTKVHQVKIEKKWRPRDSSVLSRSATHLHESKEPSHVQES